MQTYSDPSRESDPHTLPDVEIFELTAAEVAAMDEDLCCEYSKKHEFSLASINSRVHEQMIDAMIADNNISGGWFYQFCFPGCLPDGCPIGPYNTWQEAKAAAQQEAIDSADMAAEQESNYLRGLGV